jgi:hypothetical protein
MSDNPLVAAPVLRQEPVGQTLPVPTPEQEQAADQLFARPEEQHHVAADLLGMVAATQLLHDLAIESFRRVERSQHLKEEPEDTPDRDTEEA